MIRAAPRPGGASSRPALERGETQHGLAQRAGVNRVSIARIEAGDQLPRYRTLVALANALDVPMDRLLMG